MQSDVAPPHAGAAAPFQFIQPDLALPHTKLAAANVISAARRVLKHVRGKSDDKRVQSVLDRFANSFAPNELAEVYRIVESKLSQDNIARVAKLAPNWSKLLRKGGAVYDREVLAPGVLLFRSAKVATDRGALVCFTSIKAGMFASNARFLDMLGHLAIDVVILGTASGTFGRWSLGGGQSFYESLVVLRAMLAARGIVPKAYLGASSGGGPAIQAAVLDGTIPVVTLGCRFYQPGRMVRLAKAGVAFDPMCLCLNRPCPPIHNIFAKLEPIDSADDARLHALVPHARSYRIPNDARHNPIASLAGLGLLTQTIEAIGRGAFGQPFDFDFIEQLTAGRPLPGQPNPGQP